MILDSTLKSIQIYLSATVTANQLSCVSSWADITPTTFTPGSTDTQSNNTTVVTIVAAPASSTQRQIKTIYIYNTDTSSATVTVTLNDNSTVRTLVKVTLQPSYTLQFGDGQWGVTDANGNKLQTTQVNAAGSNTQIQYNNGTGLAGDANLTWNTSTQTMSIGGSNSNVTINSHTGDITQPTGTNIGIYGKNISNRFMATQFGPNGASAPLQPLMARNKVGIWIPQGNSTTVPGVFGLTAFTATGTTTARTVAVTNLGQRMRRIGYVSSATAGSLAGVYTAVAQYTCGSGTYDGSGFYFVIRWLPSDAATVSGERIFIGMSSNVSAPTNVDPSTLTNSVGVAQIGTDATQLYMVYGGSVAQTPIALGATNFPGSTLSTTPFELALYCPYNVANTYYYQVTNITTGSITTGTLTGSATVVPQSSTLLAPRAWTTNNATALAASIDLCSVYTETDT